MDDAAHAHAADLQHQDGHHLHYCAAGSSYQTSGTRDSPRQPNARSAAAMSGPRLERREFVPPWRQSARPSAARHNSRRTSRRAFADCPRVGTAGVLPASSDGRPTPRARRWTGALRTMLAVGSSEGQTVMYTRGAPDPRLASVSSEVSKVDRPCTLTMCGPAGSGASLPRNRRSASAGPPGSSSPTRRADAHAERH